MIAAVIVAVSDTEVTVNLLLLRSDSEFGVAKDDIEIIIGNGPASWNKFKHLHVCERKQ